MMGCEFEFGYTAGLLLGRAELAGVGGQFAARWRRGALERGAISGAVAARYSGKKLINLERNKYCDFKMIL